MSTRFNLKRIFEFSVRPITLLLPGPQRADTRFNSFFHLSVKYSQSSMPTSLGNALLLGFTSLLGLYI